MTADELQDAVGCSPALAAKFAEPITAAMAEHSINTPARQAAFLAQIAHESGKFKWLREIWGPTSAQMRYEGRADLGNTQPGDGKRFMGRGLIQVTGRANYTRTAIVLGIDCINYPELLEAPENAAMSAADWWEHHGCNELADEGRFETLTRRINGGMNGYTDRCIAWDKAKDAMGVA